MATTTISPKFQIVIPKEVREAMSLKPGTRFEVMQYGDQIELVPVTDARTLRGTLSGINTDVPRDDDRV